MNPNFIRTTFRSFSIRVSKPNPSDLYWKQNFKPFHSVRLIRINPRLTRSKISNPFDACIQTEWIRASYGRVYLFQSVYPNRMNPNFIQTSFSIIFNPCVLSNLKPNESEHRPDEPFNLIQSVHLNRINPTFIRSEISNFFNLCIRSNLKPNESGTHLKQSFEPF